MRRRPTPLGRQSSPGGAGRPCYGDIDGRPHRRLPALQVRMPLDVGPDLHDACEVDGDDRGDVGHAEAVDGDEVAAGDPVRSFKNLRGALRPGGLVGFACWREPKRNGWLMLPLQEAYKHVPKMPDLGPDAPGPFAFQSEQRVRGILEGAGFSSVEFEAIELTLDIANGQGIDAAMDTATGVGPASRAMDGQPAELQVVARAAIRAMLVKRMVGATVPLPASIWIVRAINQ